MLLAVAAVALAPATSSADEPFVFMGPQFAEKFCAEWNNSSLPVQLGATSQGGNGWIDGANKYTGKTGVQEIVVTRRDCDKWPNVELTLENKGGKAMCTYGGKMRVAYDKAAWAFAPKTLHWYRFATKWSAMDMPAIMDGFRGPIPVARKNIKNFDTFWKAAGHVAKTMKADYKTGCPGLSKSDAENIESFLGKIK
jgi:hypothetical protein